MLISIAAEEITRIGNFPITNSLLTTWIGMVVVIIFVLALSGRFKSVPGKFQVVLEAIYIYFLGLCENILEDKKSAKRALPFILTIFIFVFTASIPTVFPGIGSLGLKEGEHLIPLFRPGSADLNLAIALALIVVVVIQAVGFKVLGWGYLKKFFNFSSPINFFVGILELISELAKLVSFSFRLFGNIFAGEVLLAVMLMILPYLAPIPFYGLEIFVSLIQAFVFAMLTLVFIKLATISHDRENH